MLEHVETDDRVEALARDGAMVIREVETGDGHVGPPREALPQALEVFGARVGEHEARPVDQKRRKRADPRADLENAGADPGTDALEHPAVVADRIGQAIKRFRSNGITRPGGYWAPLQQSSPRSGSICGTT